MSITIKQNLVPSSKYSIKCPHTMNAEYITVHNTYNDASAENEIKYMISNNNQTSYHFAVDDIHAVQGLLLNRNGWHAGDGNGKGNRASIGIEICYSKSGGERYKKAEANAIKLIAKLLKERGWGVDRVKQHYDWSKKNCPHRIRDEGRWGAFVAAIQKEMNPPTLNGWQKENDLWYYYENSKKKVGWLNWDNRWWYLDSNGVMVADAFKKIGDFWYHFKPNGQMTNNITLHVEDNGAIKL